MTDPNDDDRYPGGNEPDLQTLALEALETLALEALARHETRRRDDLRLAMEDGTLVSSAYEHGIRSAADALSDLLRRPELHLPMSPVGVRPATPEEHVAIRSCGDRVSLKVARLIEGFAEIRGQAVELAGVVAILASVARGDARVEEACGLLLALFESTRQPYTLFDACGIRRGAAEGDPRLLEMATRSLAIDAIQEVVWRSGRRIPMRRSPLLKRFLLVVASAPGFSFSKEDLVRRVWGHEYHPLRHDPALYTSVMRVRRMLGEGGGDILRFTDGGYRFSPPGDFLGAIRTEEFASCLGPASSRTRDKGV